MWRHADGRTSATRPPEIDAAVEHSVTIHVEALRPHAKAAARRGADPVVYAQSMIPGLQRSLAKDDAVTRSLGLEAGLRALSQVLTEVWGVEVRLEVPPGGP